MRRARELGEGEELLWRSRSGRGLCALCLPVGVFFLGALAEAVSGWYAAHTFLGVFTPANRPELWRQIVVLLFFVVMVAMCFAVLWQVRVISLNRSAGLLIVRERTLFGIWCRRQVRAGDVESICVLDCRGVFRGGGFDVCLSLAGGKRDCVAKGNSQDAARELGQRVAEAVGKPLVWHG